MAGRDFDEHDTADHQNVVLISQSGAKKVFGNENPIGKTLLVTSSGTPCEIVGIVGDVRSRKVNEPDDMEFYRPWAQENFPFPTIVVRSNLKADAVTKLVQLHAGDCRSRSCDRAAAIDGRQSSRKPLARRG